MLFDLPYLTYSLLHMYVHTLNIFGHHGTSPPRGFKSECSHVHLHTKYYVDETVP